MTEATVDRRLPDREAALAAIADAGLTDDGERAVRLRPLYYPIYRLQVAYHPDDRRTETVVVDGTYGGLESALATYAAGVERPETVDPERRHGEDAPMYLPFDGDREETTGLFEDWIDECRDRVQRRRRRGGGDVDTPEIDRLHDAYGLPPAFDHETYEAVDDVARLYLPFWLVEFDGGPDGGRFLAFRRTAELEDGAAPDRHTWLTDRVTDSAAFCEAFRETPRVDAESDGDDTERRGADPVTPDGVDLSAERLLEPTPERTFEDVGGMDDLLATLRETVLTPLEKPERFERYGLGVVNGVLLHGPPGCGKTHVAGALAGELDRSYVPISPTDLTSKWVGEAADNVADAFAIARANQPCLVFIDEIDAVAADRSGDMTNTERQMVNQLLTELEAIDDENVIVVAATNLLEEIDDAVLRSGRFDERIEVPPPDEDARASILSVHLDGRPTADDLDLTAVAARTAGLAASDVALVAEAAARRALRDDAPIRNEHLRAAVEDVDTSIAGWIDAYDDLETGTTASFGDDVDRSVRQPPAVELDTEALVEAEPDIDFDGVAGAAGTLETLRTRVVEPVTAPEPYETYGLGQPSGALLYGPPGCGKTHLSRAVAGELSVPLVRVRPSDLLGVDAETPAAAVRDVAAVARANAPCVLLLDDLDDLSGHGSVAGQAHRRLLSALADTVADLTSEAVVTLGATHLVGDVYEALRRADTFDERVEVPPPGRETRRAVLADALPERLLAEGFDWARPLEATAGYSCGDLLLVAETGARRALHRDEPLRAEHLLAAIRNHRSAVADWPDREQYADSDYGSDLRYIS